MSEKKILSICIPTYNRALFLRKNLLLLEQIIVDNKLDDDVVIIVSDNHSVDSTKDVIKEIKSNSKFLIEDYYQLDNKGGIYNVFFVLTKVSSEYVMLLGDDDFISEGYMKEVIKAIHSEHISCIIPSFYAYSAQGMKLSKGHRDINIPSKIYKKGFYNCLKNSWRAHQISGLVFKVDNHIKLSSYINNLYPQIYFVASSCLQGNTLHMTDYPLKVTSLKQEFKDWNYGNDGLISDVFNNYAKIDVNRIQRFCLEMWFLYLHYWRYGRYFRQGILSGCKAILRIATGSNTSFMTKVTCVPFCFIFIGIGIVRTYLYNSILAKYDK